MKVSPILSPTGEPVFLAGGPTAYKVAEYRGFVASLEWTRRRRKFMPTLVIWPQRQSNILTVGAASPGQWAITRDAMVEFLNFDRDNKATGKPSDFAFEQATEALPILGKDRNDKQALFALLDVLVRFGPELAAMPVAPRAAKEALMDGGAMWEVTATNKSTGKTISEAAV